jgi:hypothetical protein
VGPRKDLNPGQALAVRQHLDRYSQLTGILAADQALDTFAHESFADFRTLLLNSAPMTNEAFFRAYDTYTATEVRTRGTLAREHLFLNKHAQRADMSVAEYTAAFDTLMLAVPDMGEADRICFFRSGLLPTLRSECVVDSIGREFTSLKTLAAWAHGQELRLRAKAQATPSAFPTMNALQTGWHDVPGRKTGQGARGGGPPPPEYGPPEAHGCDRGSGKRRADTPAGRPAKRPAPPPPERPNDESKVTLSNGRRLTEGEKWTFMREGRCFDCGLNEPRHVAGQLDKNGEPMCPNPKPDRYTDKGKGKGKGKGPAK